MVNRSKVRNKRNWAEWRSAGAVDNIHNAHARTLMELVKQVSFVVTGYKEYVVLDRSSGRYSKIIPVQVEEFAPKPLQINLPAGVHGTYWPSFVRDVRPILVKQARNGNLDLGIAEGGMYNAVLYEVSLKDPSETRDSECTGVYRLAKVKLR